ncbi:DUF4922 domain-containing protein [Bacteroidales bacterium OttesenSCG-928-J19]|nr:DUF4922 domain-containing protein [Bacteroidales bacterium OttesenSCG-928-J19]
MDLEFFYHQQLNQWPTVQSKYVDLNMVQKKGFSFEDFEVWVHHIPSRIVSTSAPIEAEKIQARPCPLCEENRPKQQLARTWGGIYSVALNPYPILPKHFTVMDQEHVPQGIAYRSIDLIHFAAEHPGYLSLYNGPQSGASIPDHFHFQAVPKGHLPLENDFLRVQTTEIFTDKELRVYYLRNYLRDCFVLESRSAKRAQYWVEEKIWEEIGLRTPGKGEEKEPMMNLVFSYEPKQKGIRVFIFPRRKHRPSQYYEIGDERLMVSPGTIDMAGILIAPRKEDFEKINKYNITDIYKQVSFKQ